MENTAVRANREEVEAEYRQVLADAEEIRKYWEEKNQDRIAYIAILYPPLGKEEAWSENIG